MLFFRCLTFLRSTLGWTTRCRRWTCSQFLTLRPAPWKTMAASPTAKRPSSGTRRSRRRRRSSAWRRWYVVTDVIASSHVSISRLAACHLSVVLPRVARPAGCRSHTSLHTSGSATLPRCSGGITSGSTRALRRSSVRKLRFCRIFIHGI
jgi:hypothetical protein